MALLEETTIDKDRIYFHGSSEARVDHLEAPSFQHPFYVTSDLHYAMAFCTKSQSSTGDYEVKKTFTPADQNYVYVVTLKPTCQVFDFRDKSSPEFKKLYNIIDKEIVDWVLNSAADLDFDDIYEFIIGLDQELLAKIENYSTYQQYYEASHYTSGKPLETVGKVVPQSVFAKAKTFAKTNGIQNVSELDIHETMAPILKKLNRLGFQGVLTKEHDYNDEVNWIHITPAKVTTDYAIGIFDKSGLDIVGLVPMRYKWLKKINPDYWYNSTSETASQKIKRFIQLYKRLHMKKVDESALDKKSTWYFGNNRAKNLKLAPPKWHSPFFLTTDYSYAEEYSDYGVYTITLKGEAKSKILDFSKDSDVKKLKWPKELIDDIRTGKSDLNGIAYDMYILAGYGHSQEVFDRSWHLSDAAYDFDVRSENIFDIVPKNASWAREKDHRFLLQMWKDIHDAGFDGFMHFEFGKKILALFDFKCMDKISIKPVKAVVNEKMKSRAIDESAPHGNARLSYYDVYMKSHPTDNTSNLLDGLVSEFAEDMQHCGISITDELSQQIYQKNGHINEHILDKIAKKMTRRYVWRKIKADVYAAIVSRFVNVMQQTNNQELLENNIHFSRMVSKKTIEDCLDIICHNTNVLDANAILTTSLDVDLAQSVFKKHNLVNDIRSPYSSKTYEDCSIAAALYSIWASFAPGINSKYMCRSANAPDKIRDILNSISYDASSIDLIVALNRALDVVHCQNDLSLAFIEGGKQTLSKVSSLKLDQIDEDSHQFYDIDQNDEVVAKCRNPIGKIGISTYDDINAAGIGSFEIFKPYRRMGHAKNVLQKLVKKLKSKYSSVYCFVDKDNYPALSLYKQLGKVSNHLNANGQYEVEFWKTAEDNQSTASKSIKNLFDEVVSQYIALFGIDLSYMTFKVDSQPVYTNGEPCYEYDEDECAGDWTSLGWIRLNPDMKSVIDRYGVAWHGSDDTEEFTKIIIAHELAHEVWNNIADDQFKEEILDEARQQEFSTVYLDTVRPSKLPEETFCEYLAHKITQHGFSSTDNQKT